MVRSCGCRCARACACVSYYRPCFLDCHQCVSFLPKLPSRTSDECSPKRTTSSRGNDDRGKEKARDTKKGCNVSVSNFCLVWIKTPAVSKGLYKQQSRYEAQASSPLEPLYHPSHFRFTRSLRCVVLSNRLANTPWRVRVRLGTTIPASLGTPQNCASFAPDVQG